MSQEVTGMTAFWAVLALALNAMARPSFTTKALYDPETSFENSFIPELSSPFVCFVDCLAELVVLGRVLYTACFKRKTETLPGHESSTTTNKAKRDSVAIRVLLFILGGLPQAIKMSGMRGIPLTQTLSAIFLANTALATFSELLPERAETEKKAISAWLRKYNGWLDLVRLLIFMSHGIMAATAWNMVSTTMWLHKDTPGIVLVDICLWISTITTLLAALLTIVWVLATLLAPLTFVRRFKIRVSPIVGCLPVTLLFGYPMKLLDAGENVRKGCQSCNDTTLRGLVWNTAPLIAIVASLSYVFAAALVRVTNILTRTSAHEHQTSQESEPQDQSSDHPSQRPTSGEATTAPNDSLDEPEIDPVEDLLKTGSTTLLLPFRSLNWDTEKNSEASGAASSQPSVTVGEVVTNQPSQQTQQPPNVTAPSSLSTDTSTTKPKRKEDNTAARLRISGTHWNWLLVGYSFWNFRSKIPAAYRYRWTSTSGPIHKKAYMCLCLSWDVFRLLALQSLFFAVFMVANIFDFSPVDRLCGRIARKVDPGTGRVWFAIFNLATVFGVYALAFNGSGTVNPGWTGVLGRKT